MAVYWIIMIIEFMLHTVETNGQCASSTNIVPVCTNSTDSYRQMYIPVNGGMADGCQCDVTLVKTPSETGQNIVSVSNMLDQTECGYKVVNYNTPNNDSWTCSNNEIVYYQLRLNESFPLTFTSESTPEPPSTGFCLHISTTISNFDTNTTFTITCRNKYDIAIGQTTTTPSSTITNPKLTSQTTHPKTTSSKIQTSVRVAAPDKEPVSSMTSIYGSTEQATSTPNNVLPSVTGIAVGVSFGFLALISIIVILIGIIPRKDKILGEYVSRSDVNHPDNMYDVMTPREDNHHYEMSPARDSNATDDVNIPDNMYDVMTPREDNHHYEMSPVRDSNATADADHPTYDVMVNRSPENNYQTLAPSVNNGVYVNQGF